MLVTRRLRAASLARLACVMDFSRESWSGRMTPFSAASLAACSAFSAASFSAAASSAAAFSAAAFSAAAFSASSASSACTLCRSR